MTDDGTPSGAGDLQPQLPTAASLAGRPPAPWPWITAMDGVLRGLAHQLSNRAGTVRAVSDALQNGSPDSRLASALVTEADRLEDLLRLVRLLPREVGRAAEPVRPADVVADAVALFAHHDAGRERLVSLVALENAVPVRVRVPSLTHAILLLLVEAAGPEASEVQVRGGGDDRQSRLAIAGPGADGPAAEDVAAAATAILAADGATVVARRPDVDSQDAAFVILIPSLLSTRSEKGVGADAGNGR